MVGFDTLFWLISFDVFVIFPIFLASQAGVNGYKRCAWATFLSIFISIFVPLSPLIALLAYFKTKNPSEKAIYKPLSPNSVNGIGNMFLGVSNRLPDGSFVTTEWGVLLGIPIAPEPLNDRK